MQKFPLSLIRMCVYCNYTRVRVYSQALEAEISGKINRSKQLVGNVFIMVILLIC